MVKKRFTKNQIIYLLTALIVCLLVAVMITATVVLSGAGKVKAEGVIGKDENGASQDVVSETTYDYDISVYTGFARCVKDYLSVLFTEEALDSLAQSSGADLSRRIGDSVISFCRKARISSEKVIRFGKYLSNESVSLAEFFDGGAYIDSLDNLTEADRESIRNQFLDGNKIYPFEYWLLRMCVYDISSGKYVFDESGAAFAKMVAATDWQGLTSELSVQTGITPDEMGRMCYYAAVSSAENEETAALITELGEDSFVSLFAHTTVALSEFSLLYEGSSLASTRIVYELFYEVGTELLQIVDTFGVHKLDALFGSFGDFDFSDDTERGEQIAALLASADNAGGFVVAFLGRLLANMNNDIATAYYQCVKQGASGNYEALTLSLLCKAMDGALDYAQTVSTYKTDDAVATKLAKLVASMIAVSDKSVVLSEAITEQEAQLTACIGAIRWIADNAEQYDDISEVDAALAESRQDDTFAANIALLKSYSPTIEDGARMTVALILFNFLDSLTEK